MKRVVLTLSVFSVMFFGASILEAVQPDMYTVSGSGIGWVGECGDFDVLEDVTYEIAVKDYFNNDGDWIKTKAHWTVEGVVFNADAPENYLPYKNSVYTEHYEVDTGETRVTGLWALVTVPGYGSIFMDVGLLIYDAGGNIIFEAGKHQWFNANVDALCDHLAE